MARQIQKRPQDKKRLVDELLWQKQQMHLQEYLNSLALEVNESLYGWFDWQNYTIENMDNPIRVSDEVLKMLKTAHSHCRVFRYTQETTNSSKLEVWM